MTKLQQIEHQYGSFESAVRKHLVPGVSSKITVARALGLDPTHFRRLLRRTGVDALFPQPSTPTEEVKKISAEDLLHWVFKCRTTKDFTKEAPYNLGTVYDRFGSWWEAKDIARNQRMKQRQVELYGCVLS